MNGSRLLEIFQHLDKKELRGLGKFVRSPFHNQRKDVIALYDYLLNYLKTKQKLSVEKAIVFPFLFPNEPYSEKKIRYTISFLNQCVKDFLAYQEFTADKNNQQLSLIKALRKKGTDRLFEVEIKELEKQLERQEIRNQQYHFQNFLVQEEKYFFNLQNTRGTMIGFQESVADLDKFFIANRLKQITHALTHKRLGHAEFKPPFFDFLMTYLAEKDYSDSPSIEIYLCCIKILTKENSLTHFRYLRQLIDKQGHWLPKRELLDIYIFALNFCIKKLNANEVLFNREAFELYKQGLKQKVLFENNLLSRFNYKNIVAFGLILEEFTWVKQFIEDYKPYLEKKYRESTYCFNLAMFFYKKQDYSEAMTLLQQVSSNDTLNNLSSRRMLARIYYDRQEFDALYSLLDSFQNYIYRKREISYHKQFYLNFIKFTRKLLQKEAYSNEQVRALREEIEGTKNVAEKVWLLEKLG